MLKILQDKGGNGAVEGDDDLLLPEGAEAVQQILRVHGDGEIDPLGLRGDRLGDVAVFRRRGDAYGLARNFDADEIVLVSAVQNGGALGARDELGAVWRG